jgi:glutamate-1-semialdehyde 2,1-aminomutase
MFHVILGADCPAPIDGFTWDWKGKPGSSVPVTTAFWDLRRGMLNEGVDLMGAGGMVSAVHSNEDIAQTVGAFERTLVRLKEEGAL